MDRRLAFGAGLAVGGVALAVLAIWLARAGLEPPDGGQAATSPVALTLLPDDNPRGQPAPALAEPPATEETRAEEECPTYFGALLSLRDGAPIAGGTIRVEEPECAATIRSEAAGRFSWRPERFTGEALRARSEADGFVPAWHRLIPGVENRVALAPAARFRVHVTDARTGLPVPGACVRTVLHLVDEPEAAGLTDERGMLEADVPWAFERLEVDAEGYEMGYGPGSCAAADREARVALDPAVLLKIVVSDEQGAPVADPRFTVDPPGRSITAEAAERWEGRPVYSVRCRRWSRVTVAADGYASQAVDAGAAGAAPVEVRLARGFTLLLIVVSDGGVPLPAEVALSEEAIVKDPPLASYQCLVQADAAGLVRLAGLGRGGQYVLTVRAPKHLERDVEFSASAERDEETLRIVLAQADKSVLAGRVVDRESGAGIGGARVAVTGTSGLFAVTGDDGAFACPVPAEGGQLHVRKPEYCPAAVSVAEASANGGVIVLSRGASIQGSVVDQTGRPVPCARVTCGETSDYSDQHDVVADIRGLFEISGLGGSLYCLGATAPWNTKHVASVNARPGDRVRLEVWQGADLRVRVLCGAGATPRWTLYVAEFADGGETWRAFKPTAGLDEQRVIAPAGECWIKVRAEGCATVIRRVVLEAGTSSRLDVALAAGSRVEVRLREAQDGAALAGAVVRMDLRVADGVRTVNVAFAETDAEGVATFRLADGVYQAAARTADGREASRLLAVNGDAKVEIDL